MTETIASMADPALGSVLLVDDETLVLKATGRYLAHAGYDVVATGDVHEAASLLSLRRFDAVVTDLRLPTRSGSVFAVEVAALAPHVPLLVVTGMSDLHEIWALVGASRIDALIPRLDAHTGLTVALARLVASGRDAAARHHNARFVADGLVRALAFRDVETEAHSRRVSAWTVLLAGRMGVPKDDWLHAELGGLLHDVGKIGVSDAILRKAGPLSEEEWVEMRRHPDIGCAILAGIPSLVGVCDVIHWHHERWDGKGYPDGLAGAAIPPLARMFALIDTYDALTADRPYRRGRDHETAVGIIRAETGRQFDPDVVAAFLGIPEDDWLAVARVFKDHGGASA